MRYGPMVLRRCRGLLRNEGQAVDAMQDVFVALLKHPVYRAGPISAALLHRIATNVCLNRLRSTRRHPEDATDALALEIAACGDGDLEARWSARSWLQAAFGRTPESTRTIALLHLVDGMTLEETAREVGMSVSGVRKRLRILKEQLHHVEAER